MLTRGRTWSCPECNESAVTTDAKIPMHTCRGMVGLMVPLVPDGVRAKHSRVDRGDYVGRDVVAVDGEGRPVMSVVTTRDDGEDCTIYAPTASAGIEGT